MLDETFEIVKQIKCYAEHRKKFTQHPIVMRLQPQTEDIKM